MQQRPGTKEVARKNQKLEALKLLMNLIAAEEESV